jgi:hypothetical protein
VTSGAITAPVVVARDPADWPGSVVGAGQSDVCVFYRRLADAQAAASSNSLVFDGEGRRLLMVDGELRVSPTNSDGAQQLSALLTSWLGYMDAIRGSAAGTLLPRLIELCVEHAAQCGLYR